MTEAASYFTAAVPEPVRCLGLPLKPFSLGHYITLSRFQSVFVDDAAVEFNLKEPGQLAAMRDEIIFAAVVCYFSYEDFYKFIRQPDMAEQLEELGKTSGLFSVKEKAKLLSDYIKTASEMPPYVNEDENRKTSGAHWAQTVKVAVVGHCGYSHSEALNAPLQQVLADFLKHAESNGAVTLISDEENRQIKELEKN